MADQPEAGGNQQVQASSTPRDAAAAVAAQMQSELGASGESQQPGSGGRAPEASPAGTGDGGQQQPEIDWTNPEAREAYLKEKFVSPDEVERRLKDQRRNFQSQLDLAAQAKKQQEQQALLAELDDLRANDPEAYAERLNTDTAAAKAVIERASQISPAVLEQASFQVASGLAKMLFEVMPDLEPVAEAAGEDWQKVVNPETGGIFGHVRRASLDEGKRQGIEEFKSSKEFRDMIAEAERRGAHGAFGGSDMRTLAPEGGSPVATQQTTRYDDPAQAAVAAAARELGIRNIDMSKIRAPRQATRHR